MDTTRLATAIARQWDAEIVPQLVDYVRIPAKSPHFDPDVADERPHRARDPPRRGVGAARSRCAGSTVEIVRLPGARRCCSSRCPAGRGARTVLLYGHLDKQPEMIGWREDGGPWEPLIEDGKLYGRGGADDGYAMFASLVGDRRACTRRACRMRAASA